MNYASIEVNSLKNGDGNRIVLFVQGCTHHCTKCHNPETWNPNLGKPFTEDTLNQIIEILKDPYVDGITFSGGDPLAPFNIDTVTKISKKIRELFPNKTQWLYTGYSYVSIKKKEIIKYLDVIVTEKYDYTKPSSLWVGSNNQQVIRLK